MPVLAVASFDSFEDAATLIRSMLNDVPGNVFTDSFILPLLNKAYRRVQKRLGNNGDLGITEDDYEVNIPAGSTIMDFQEAPLLPEDLFLPLEMWEQPTSAYDPGNFVPMSFSPNALPSVQQTGALIWWRWSSNQITFVPDGANVDITVRLKYRRILPNLQVAADPIQNISAMDAIASYTGYLCSRGKGGEIRADFLADYNTDIEELLNAVTLSQQNVTRRRRPYGYTRGRALYL